MSDGTVCDDCLPVLTALKDERDGFAETCRRQAAALGKARREDPDKRLRDHEEWGRALRLFRIWQRQTGHVRSKWTVQRFKQCLPFLADYEDEVIVRAITGIAYDPFTTRNRNGLEERHDGWDTLFATTDRFERYANKAPRNWGETLEEYADELAKLGGGV